MPSYPLITMAASLDTLLAELGAVIDQMSCKRLLSADIFCVGRFKSLPPQAWVKILSRVKPGRKMPRKGGGGGGPVVFL